MDSRASGAPPVPRGGNEIATADLFAKVYTELHAIARSSLRSEHRSHTLQATALVHEVYLRLARARRQPWSEPTHLLAVAARAIRRVLINHAAARRALRRGGVRQRVPMPVDAAIPVALDGWDLLALGEALTRLERLDPRQGRIVELRFFGGLSTTEIARVLGVCPRTVEGEWSMARAWLRRSLSNGPEDS